MRITTPNGYKSVFGSISRGDCFIYHAIGGGESYFMRTEQIEIYDDDGGLENCYNAVELSTGDMYEICDDEPVTPVDIEAKVSK